jgi:hypothetical protein
MELNRRTCPLGRFKFSISEYLSVGYCSSFDSFDKVLLTRDDSRESKLAPAAAPASLSRSPSQCQ